MHTELGELLEAYECELDILSFSYDMMGQMLNKKHMEHRIELLGVSDIYIYGGGYLGIQLYNAISQLVNVLNIVDKSGRLLMDIPNIPVMSLEKFRSVYRCQKIIITPIKHYQAIYRELSEFVPEDKMIFLGELLGGIL